MKRALVLLLLVSPAQVGAYELTGGSWRQNAYPGGVPWCPVVNAVDATTQTMRTAFANALDGAMLAWTEDGYPSGSIPGIPCSAYNSAKSSCSGSPNVGDSQPWVWWETAWTSIAGVGPSTICVTPYWTSGTELVQAKVIFNDQNYYWSTNGSATDVGSIAVHELGHFIGMGHYDEYSSGKRQECYSATYPSVMCAAYSNGVARIPTADDVLGVCYLYPRTGAMGSSCTTGSSCNSDICHVSGYCSQACPPACPLGYSCVSNRCERDQGTPTCAQCGSAPCGAGSVCVGASGGSFCAPPCNNNTDCLLGFWCGIDTGSGGACWPLGNTCTSSAPTAGQTCGFNGTCALGNICLQTPVGDKCYQVCDTRDDCTNSNHRCYDTSQPGVSYCDAGSTTCDCDSDSACTQGCGCDLDCNDCSCNLTTRCEPTCGCDPHCIRCSCDTTLGCDGGCDCDPDCADCACDVTVACDPGCACDKQCPCLCDTTTICDGDCNCDPECLCLCDTTTACDPDCDYCDPECGGCFSAALIPSAAPGSRADLAPLLGVFIGLGWLRRRRR